MVAEPSLPGLWWVTGTCDHRGSRACGRLSLDGGTVWPVPTLSMPAPDALGASTRHVVSWKAPSPFPAPSLGISLPGTGQGSWWLRICAQGVSAASSLCGKGALSPLKLLPSSPSRSMPKVPKHRAVTSAPAAPRDRDWTAGARRAVPAPPGLSHPRGGQASPLCLGSCGKGGGF